MGGMDPVTASCPPPRRDADSPPRACAVAMTSSPALCSPTRRPHAAAPARESLAAHVCSCSRHDCRSMAWGPASDRLCCLCAVLSYVTRTTSIVASPETIERAAAASSWLPYHTSTEAVRAPSHLRRPRGRAGGGGRGRVRAGLGFVRHKIDGLVGSGRRTRRSMAHPFCGAVGTIHAPHLVPRSAVWRPSCVRCVHDHHAVTCDVLPKYHHPPTFHEPPSVSQCRTNLRGRSPRHAEAAKIGTVAHHVAYRVLERHNPRSAAEAATAFPRGIMVSLEQFGAHRRTQPRSCSP